MVSFLDLPYSIRKRIYRYALVKKRIFVRPFMSMGYLIDADRTTKYGVPNINLLRASKQIYVEAMPIYLGENTFSIVQIDLLAAACAESERVAYNLKLIRKVELVIDTRDYIYMAQYLLDELKTVKDKVEEYAYDSVDKRRVIECLLQLRTRLDVPGFDQTVPESIASRSSPEGQRKHQRHILNMKDLLWGRSLTFIRQTFRLSSLYLDMRHATCLSGCCRLATEVLDWGWFYVWLYGLPDEVQIRCYSEHEKKIITRTLNTQRLHHGLKLEKIYDRQRVADYRDLAMNNVVFKDACHNLKKNLGRRDSGRSHVRSQ